ncbi:hypothetical protein AGLY_015505 [Aphis glycines]|uniref:Uncharacterized protein n=1 Tax=Aphis glycines TaxID=307491 RepID=A0A6G0T0G4_APHGL|nr:hypothetical protein AGLY_015505 [Aphis glycines]
MQTDGTSHYAGHIIFWSYVTRIPAILEVDNQVTQYIICSDPEHRINLFDNAYKQILNQFLLLILIFFRFPPHHLKIENQSIFTAPKDDEKQKKTPIIQMPQNNNIIKPVLGYCIILASTTITLGYVRLNYLQISLITRGLFNQHTRRNIVKASPSLKLYVIMYPSKLNKYKIINTKNIVFFFQPWAPHRSHPTNSTFNILFSSNDSIIFPTELSNEVNIPKMHTLYFIIICTFCSKLPNDLVLYFQNEQLNDLPLKTFSCFSVYLILLFYGLLL